MHVENVNPFPVIVVCSLFCLCTLVSSITNTMDPDQTAPLGDCMLAQSGLSLLCVLSFAMSAKIVMC